MGWDSHFGEFTDSAEEKHIVFQQAVNGYIPDILQELFRFVFFPAFCTESLNKITFIEYTQSS